MPLFTVEGVIGAGKTSLLKALESAQPGKSGKKPIIVYEPVEKWMNTKLDGPDSPSLFEKYYADKNRFGFMFQMFALQTRVADILQVVNDNPDAIIICERSHMSDCEIFAQMMFESGILTKEEYHVYKEWYDMCMKYLFPRFDAAIYVGTSPSVCVERIMSRARTGEEHISFDYIMKLHRLHEKWVTNASLPVYTLDGNICAKASPEDYARLINGVVEFCESYIL